MSLARRSNQDDDIDEAWAAWEREHGGDSGSGRSGSSGGWDRDDDWPVDNPRSTSIIDRIRNAIYSVFSGGRRGGGGGARSTPNLKLIGIGIAVALVLFFVIKMIVTGDGSFFQRINEMFESLFTALLTWLILSALLWFLVDSILGKGTSQQSARRFAICAIVVLLCRLIPSLGYSLITLAIMLYLFKMILGGGRR